MIFLLSSLIAQFGHTAHAINVLEVNPISFNGIALTGYFFAFAFETGIFYFTLRGRKRVSIFLAVCTFLVNCMYFFDGLQTFKGIGWNFSVLFLSVMLPFVIAAYSDEMNVEDKEAEEKFKEFIGQLHAKDKDLATLNERLKELEVSNNEKIGVFESRLAQCLDAVPLEVSRKMEGVEASLRESLNNVYRSLRKQAQ